MKVSHHVYCLIWIEYNSEGWVVSLIRNLNCIIYNFNAFLDLERKKLFGYIWIEKLVLIVRVVSVSFKLFAESIKRNKTFINAQILSLHSITNSVSFMLLSRVKLTKLHKLENFRFWWYWKTQKMNLSEWWSSRTLFTRVLYIGQQRDEKKLSKSIQVHLVCLILRSTKNWIGILLLHSSGQNNENKYWFQY